MIKIEKEHVVGFEDAIRGMRNPMNSWDRSDSDFACDADCGYPGAMPCEYEGRECGHIKIGTNDHDLMMRLARGGSVHGKFRRMIAVYVDITAPLYWWKEFDTYKVGTVANSCSTMHKIHEKEFMLDDFSHEHLFESPEEFWGVYKPDTVVIPSLDVVQTICMVLNDCRKMYLKTKDTRYWWQMIQLLPSSYNQKRTVMLNYEVLANIYQYRKEHKLDEWREFCKWTEKLPYSEIITCNAENKS